MSLMEKKKHIFQPPVTDLCRLIAACCEKTQLRNIVYRQLIALLLQS